MCSADVSSRIRYTRVRYWQRKEHHRTTRLRSKRVSLWILFAAYVAMAFLFAGLYYHKYRLSPGAFVFNSEVASARAVTLTSDYVTRLTRLRSCDSLLFAARSALDSGTVQRSSRSFRDGEIGFPSLTITLSDFRAGAIFVSFITQSRAGGTVTVSEADHDSTVHRSTSLSFSGVTPSSVADAKRELAMISDSIAKSISATEIALAALVETRQPTWAFGDFLYFSVVTQTTVGFGDILPNARNIRELVVIQCLLSLGLVLAAGTIALPMRR